MREAAKDRISNLPEDLLHHIHSFLDIKDGARTSVLSKKWNYIWTTVPILDLRCRNYVPNLSETDKFMDFVDGTFRRRLYSSNIDKFSISWNQQLSESRVHSWISTVLRGNVKELSLVFSPIYPSHNQFPSLFTCDTLISLKLQTYPNIHFPKYISFPRLKRLEIHQFEFSDGTWNDQLFSNSTVLEELILHCCSYFMKNFCISIPTLKLLNIYTWCRVDNGLPDCVFKIDAPGLVSFSYGGSVAKRFVLSNFPVLVKAAVNFTFEENGSPVEISRLLHSLAHAKYLTVDDQALKYICSASHLSNNLLRYHNVKVLETSNWLTTDEGLIALLKAVPNLESLIIKENMKDKIELFSDVEDENDSDDTANDGDADNEDDNADSVTVEDDENDGDNAEGDGGDSLQGDNNQDNEDEGDVAGAAVCGSSNVSDDNCDNQDNSWDIVTTGCLFPHLQSVCFHRFVGNPRELRWVRQILRDAKALQKMTIHYFDSYGACRTRYVNGRSEEEVILGIPSYPRASAGCLFKFYSREDWKSVVNHRR